MDDERDRDSRRNQLQVLAAVFGAVTGWTVGVLTDPAGGLIVGAAATEAARTAMDWISGDRGRQVVAMWEITAQAAEQTHDELLARVTADPHRRQLFAAAVRAAADTALQAKLDAIGHRLAMGVMAADDDGIEVQRVIIETLGDLELPHWQTLRQITLDYEGYGEPFTEDGIGQRHGWTMEALRAHLPSLTPIIGSVIPVLAARGLIANTSLGTYDYGGQVDDRWIVTDYGRACLAELEGRGQENRG
jgi:hypothetical protein